ncbi:MAG: M14 family metallopeptidase, partial [Bacteroidota bacterium]
MRPILLILICTICYLQTFAQASTAAYSRVKIDLTTTTIQRVAQLGLEADHGEYAKGRHLINDYSKREIELLKANGIAYEILIEDVKAHYVQQNLEGHEHHHQHQVAVRNVDNCDGSLGTGPQYNYTTPVNYQYGSMGGYQTYDELLVTLDQMAALYPNLISVKQPIGDIVTHEDRPIYWLRISDNPTVNEDEPEVLYTALHHAREANSLSQLVFYMWYLLENYETDEEIKYLVDHTEMYFVPCVNPDGYIYNEQTDPNGGGLWRKNRYAEGGQVYGVDLNRNYDYQWAADDIGSSNDPNTNTYRGTAGFSEPETQAIRDFCNQHQFKICLNYHTHGNLLIYPWGYNDQITNDHATFLAFSDLMLSENNFSPGTPIQTVGYTVNGVSDDWMYGETSTKPPIFSFTPEVGPSNLGFWPPQTAIDQLNKSALLLNLTTAHLLLNYGEAEEVDPSNYLAGLDGNLTLNLKKYGLLGGDLSL